ncbi:thiamine pyrophosphate-binding protein [Aquincola sp. S2]|uniref:Thiamine pyrophosphate-binding protein n=1 Tax=Pseudaquabacterium terrae TaxID=2732868 RepID=A0ABX2EN14_9BURK|nr:thiamine pyrophosphate-binding protein [Aquabacterium terrae]NRF70008.1 thiamine pyrophosphate-binding protein [Aquabacterium terrae]
MDNALARADVFRRDEQAFAAPVDAADLIIRSLEALGVEYVFGIPGGAIEPLYNALARSARRGGPQPVVARHETGAACMADGYARETGKLGVCIATSGPGATNLITGVACAYDNQVPLLVLTGQPPQHSWGKRALQESSCSGIDTVAMLRHCTRYSSLVSHPDQLWPKLHNALMKAQGFPQGPAHLSLPVDLLRGPLPTPPAGNDWAGALLRRAPEVTDGPAIEELHALLAGAKQPVFLIGHGCAEAAPLLMRLVQMHGALFITTPDGKGLVHPQHPAYRGVFGFGGHANAEALLAAEPDLIVAFGTTFSELNSGGWAAGLMNRRLVHVDCCDENLMYSPSARLHVRGRISTVCEQLISMQQQRTHAGNVLPFPERRGESAAADGLLCKPEAFHSEATPIKPQRLMKALSRLCPPNTRFVADAGNSAVWAVHYLSPHDRRAPRAAHEPLLLRERRQHRAGWLRVTMDFAPMGWAIGASIGIAAGNRDCPVVCITGDGSYLMNGQEITVAAEAGLPVLFVVLNDGALGMVKHGQRFAGAEAVGFQLPSIDYAALAAAMGIPGHVIRSPQDLEALDMGAILSRKGPTLLDVRVDGEEAAPMNLRMRTLGTAK